MKKSKAFTIISALAAVYCLCTPAAASADTYDCGLITVQCDESGVLTLDSGQEWFKVSTFENGCDYIITVRDDSGEETMLSAPDGEHYVWHYYRQVLVSSMSAETSSLTSGYYSLYRYDDTLTVSDSISSPYGVYWEINDSALSCFSNGKKSFLRYSDSEDVTLEFTDVKEEAAEVCLYTRGEKLERCITSQPCAESYVIENSGYAAPTFSVGLADVTPDSISWFVDGEEQSCDSLTFTADSLTDNTAGVHRIKCIVEAHDDKGIHYRETSAEAAFVIAKGVVPDSFMTFSDIHEEYGLSSDAIERIIEESDGYIPSLVICTGDFINGPTPDTRTALDRYFPQLEPHLGGLDAVYVAGNHDPSEAAAIMSVKAGLGAQNDLSASGGAIFSGGSEAVRNNGTNSNSARGIIVYGLNFEAAQQKTDGALHFTYEKAVSDVEDFLRNAAVDYHGELIVISAHSGLHVLGVQPESTYPDNGPLWKWQGENSYNIDMSYELAETINKYAEEYGMDIIYLFGHDHSRQEKELFLTDGDTLFSPVIYAERSYYPLSLSFTYAHAGYLSSVIGSADCSFSFIRRNGDTFSFDLISLSSGKTRHTEFKAKHPYEEPAAENTTENSIQPTTATTIVNVASSDSDTGDAGTAIPFALMISAAVTAFALRGKHLE